MEIQVSTDSNIEGREELVRRVEDQLEATLARFSDRITRVEVHLGDESAGRSSRTDQRCMLEARPAGRAPVAVTNFADTMDAAIRGAADKLVRALESEFGRLADRKGGDTIRGAERS